VDTCSNGLLDAGSESDVDCGGSSCAPCVVGRLCNTNSDCGGDSVVCSAVTGTRKCHHRAENKTAYVPITVVLSNFPPRPSARQLVVLQSVLAAAANVSSSEVIVSSVLQQGDGTTEVQWRIVSSDSSTSDAALEAHAAALQPTLGSRVAAELATSGAASLLGANITVSSSAGVVVGVVAAGTGVVLVDIPSDSDASVQEAQADGGFPLALVIAVLFVLLAVAAVGVLLVRSHKRKRQEQQASQGAKRGAPPSKASASSAKASPFADSTVGYEGHTHCNPMLDRAQAGGPPASGASAGPDIVVETTASQPKGPPPPPTNGGSHVNPLRAGSQAKAVSDLTRPAPPRPTRAPDHHDGRLASTTGPPPPPAAPLLRPDADAHAASTAPSVESVESSSSEGAWSETSQSSDGELSSSDASRDDTSGSDSVQGDESESSDDGFDDSSDDTSESDDSNESGASG
jgi:hypothetical protein